MSFPAFIILMIITTIVSWSAWGVVIFSINPYEADFLGIIFFYISLFFSLLGTFSIIGSIIRKKLVKKDILFRQVVISFRQAILFSLLIATSLFLQSGRILTWWNILILVATLSVIELFAISKKASNSF
jgi:hypothetical protein